MKGDRHRSDWVPPQGRTHSGGPMSSARMVSQPPEPELRKEERSWIPAGHSCCRPGMRAATTRSRDYQIVWGARHGGAFDHMSVAVLAKDTRGVLRVGRHGSTAKDLALGGSVLSAALLIVAPAVDATVVAAADVVLPGAKGIAAHLHLAYARRHPRPASGPAAPGPARQTPRTPPSRPPRCHPAASSPPLRAWPPAVSRGFASGSECSGQCRYP
jgi:hypothetical protein